MTETEVQKTEKTELPVLNRYLFDPYEFNKKRVRKYVYEHYPELTDQEKEEIASRCSSKLKRSRWMDRHREREQKRNHDYYMQRKDIIVERQKMRNAEQRKQKYYCDACDRWIHEIEKHYFTKLHAHRLEAKEKAELALRNDEEKV